jgi:hypothetical protein
MGLARFMAVLSRAMCENACGKLPRKRRFWPIGDFLLPYITNVYGKNAMTHANLAASS